MLGLRGTKPWTGGTTLTSSGLRDLDGILGGGQPLGTCLLVEEDRWTQSLALSVVRYWCAEVRPVTVSCCTAVVLCFLCLHISGGTIWISFDFLTNPDFVNDFL